jgi:hypothetical protein
MGRTTRLISSDMTRTAKKTTSPTVGGGVFPAVRPAPTSRQRGRPTSIREQMSTEINIRS